MNAALTTSAAVFRLVLIPFCKNLAVQANPTFSKIKDEGVQQLEALFYTLNKINLDPTILPGIRLGALVIDSCDSTAYALEQTMDFIKVIKHLSISFHSITFHHKISI